MENTPYFILIVLYAAFIGSVVALNLFVLLAARMLRSVWLWQRGRDVSRDLSVTEGMVAHAP